MWHGADEKKRLEKRLISGELSFAGTYMALGQLQELVREMPDLPDYRTVDLLEKMLLKPAHTKETQALALYKRAAMVLNAVIRLTPSLKTFKLAFGALGKNLIEAGPVQHRAAAEALGGLPFENRRQGLPDQEAVNNPAQMHWVDFFRRIRMPLTTPFEFKGRSLVLAPDRSGFLWVVKYADNAAGATLLEKEAQWMACLNTAGREKRHMPHVLMPMEVHNGYVFRPNGFPLPHEIRSNPDHQNGPAPDVYAMAYKTEAAYFAYPNSRKAAEKIPPEAFVKIMCNNAGWLGRMAGRGVVHTAPIALFHNRTQAHRRADRGIYEWPRAGRLDRWLDSCKYPNFSMAGPRDFEHLVYFDGTDKRYYLYVGTHILSLILVMGSYFRNKNPRLKGRMPDGRAVDARHLFDTRALALMIEAASKAYCKNFVSATDAPHMPMNYTALSERLIEEMGQDRHMTEVLRKADQDAMAMPVFKTFLRARGCTEQYVSSVRKGEKDITLLSGPHLGAFNSGISVPELIRFLATVSATCIGEKYRIQRVAQLR